MHTCVCWISHWDQCSQKCPVILGVSIFHIQLITLKIGQPFNGQKHMCCSLLFWNLKKSEVEDRCWKIQKVPVKSCKNYLRNRKHSTNKTQGSPARWSIEENASQLQHRKNKFGSRGLYSWELSQNHWKNSPMWSLSDDALVHSYWQDLKEINWVSYSRGETMHVGDYHRVNCRFIPFLSHCDWFIYFYLFKLRNWGITPRWDRVIIQRDTKRSTSVSRLWFIVYIGKSLWVLCCWSDSAERKNHIKALGVVCDLEGRMQLAIFQAGFPQWNR